MKKIAKWVSIAMGLLVSLIIILFLLFYFPPFQNWVVGKAAAVASEKTGMKISVGHVRLAFPLDLALEQVEVLEPSDSLRGRTDTVAHVGRAVADIRLLPLLKSQVMVDELSLQQMKVNTTHFISNMRLSGSVGNLKLKAHGIDLAQESVRINDALLDNASLLVELADTAKPDTTPSENFWKVNLDDIKIKNVAFAMRMPGDSMGVGMRMNAGQVRGVFLDLHKGLYAVNSIHWDGGRLDYDQTFMPRVQGVDPNHIALDSLSLRADSFYFCGPSLNVRLRSASFREKSGLTVSSVTGAFSMDSTQLSLPSLRLKTPSSDLFVNFRMDANAFADSVPGKLNATIRGTVGSQDVLTLASPYMPRELVGNWPRVPLVVNASVGGNLQKLHVSRLYANMPGALKVSADGFVGNITDPKRLKADMNVDAHTGNLGFVTAMLPRSVTTNVAIPDGIGLQGKVKVDGERYAANFVARQGGGSLRGSVELDAARMAYDARLVAGRLPLANFLKHQPLKPFTGTITAHGQGTDFMSPSTKINAVADIKGLQYDRYNLDNIKLTAQARDGHIIVSADGHNHLFRGLVGIDALARGKMMHATLTCDLAHADLQGLGIVNEPLAVSVCGTVDVTTDLDQYYLAQGLLSDITVSEGTKHYRPNDVVLDILATRDTTHAVVDCNDFHLSLNSSGSYASLFDKFGTLTTETRKQLTNRRIDQERLRALLPQMQMVLNTGKDNFIARGLAHYGLGFNSVNLDFTSSPAGGLNGTAQAYGIVADSICIDTVRLNVSSAQKDMAYSLEVYNGPQNPQVSFHAFLDGALTEHGTWIKPRVYDAKGRLGASLGLMASIHDNGVSLHLFGDNPILGYKEFVANDSNYIFLGDDRRVRADMQLRADDGMGVQIYSNDDDTDVLQDVTVSLHRFNIGQILSVLPYAPNVTGIMNGDFHAIQTEEQLSVSSSVNVGKLTYEECPLGNVATEFTYMPKTDGSHYVDGIVTRDGEEVCTLTGTYYSAGKGVLDATMTLARMPMDFLNGFVPDKIIGFKGYAEGSVALKGHPATPEVNGELYLDSCYMFSEPYGVQVRFANDPVAIKDSRIEFENFEIFANNDSPLNLQGYVDFHDLSAMAVNIRMRAENYMLINAKETARSEAFGKAYINFYGTASGLLDNLKMRGRVDVLGTTDLKYNLKDSPLTTDNQLQGLVDFVNFSDTTTDVVNRPPVTGLDMDLTLSIDDGAHVEAYLNAAKTNYIDVVGGGSMRMQYNTADGIVLRGRYTIGSGEMKYALPVIPLKTFTIAEDSYIEFNGDPMNPALNLTATEQTKSTVGSESGNGRVVQFTCGVKVSQTLQNMGLEFTIDAPEDMTIHNQLQAMTKEERGKQAVTMLTTGMYLADGNTSSFSMNSALSAFLNSQINQISGKALRSLDIGFGVDNSFNGSGELHTDYSFKFARRFWNNRLKVSIGGKLSSGADASLENETFFDNVSLEYRLSAISNKYLNLFYVRDSYDWLEGNVSRFGGGFLWRRKLSSLSDLFRFSDKENADSVKTDSLGSKAAIK